jgi:hypothetical protein
MISQLKTSPYHVENRILKFARNQSQLSKAIAMRLLNAYTWQLEGFANIAELPKYATLSHTWGNEEVLFEDIDTWESKSWQLKAGFTKFKFCLEQALADKLEYVWIDTCCIDKSSSAELSEAINSMFNWYSQAVICYVYLNDAEYGKQSIEKCRWFSRGWTLQELIAPKQTFFYDKHWSFLGQRQSLALELSAITRIDYRLLNRSEPLGPRELESYSIATRMSWASTRQTTREEDEAHALLGIFNVNMPLLYGEGKRAFIRLQEEIIRKTTDTSILAFIPDQNREDVSPLLAGSVTQFYSPLCASWPLGTKRSTMKIEKNTIHLLMRIIRLGVGTFNNYAGCYYGVFEVATANDPLLFPVMLLAKIDNASDVFRRVYSYVKAIGPDGSYSLTPEHKYHLIESENIFDPSNIRWANIVLHGPTTLEEGCITPPVARLHSLLVEPSPPFTLETTYPVTSNNTLTPSPRGHWRHAEELGYLSFVNGQERFLVVWGFVEGSDRYLAPNCWVWPLNRQESTGFEEYLSLRGGPIPVWDLQDIASEIAPALHTRKAEDSRSIGRPEGTIVISTKISSSDFLGRQMFLIEVKITKGED